MNQILIEDFDFLNFIVYIDFKFREYKLLSEFRIKGFIMNELIEFCDCGYEKEIFLEEIQNKYLLLFTEPIFDNYSEVEQLIIEFIFGNICSSYFNNLFLLMLDNYFDDAPFYKVEFMTKIMPRAIKEYEINKINLSK